MVHLFGDKIRELREKKGISQKNLGEMFDVTSNAVYSWENNKAQPSIEIIKQLADYFDVSTDYLLGFNQDDLDNIERLKIALKEAGIMAGDDLTIEEFEKALQIVEMLKERKD